jgi:type IV pilus assembly protein PilA
MRRCGLLNPELGSMRQDNRGFTLIELLIVVVIIGILAAIAIPKFRTTKEEAYTSKMKGDLRNLATAQEAFLTDNGVYYNGAVPAAALVYNPSVGVAITLANVTVTGWGATATSPGLTTRTCAVYFGSGGPLGPATSEGRVACTP